MSMILESSRRAGSVLCLLILLLVAPVGEAADDPIWHPDLAPAQALAAEQGQDLLVMFTGSDWCKWCIQLDREVFSRASFKEYAAEHFVLVALDFPDQRGEVIRNMRAALVEANWKHKQHFGVEGFPTVLLMTPEGEVWGRTGYRKGGAEAYVQHLEELRAEREKMLASYRGLSDADPARKLDAAYELMPVARGELAERILTIIRKHDDKDSRLVLAQEALLAYIDKYLSDPVSWDDAAKALERLPETTPSVRRLAEFHAYRAIMLARTEESRGDVVEAVGEADRLGLAEDTRTWLLQQLEQAGVDLEG